MCDDFYNFFASIPYIDAGDYFKCIRQRGVDCVFLDSAVVSPDLGRYSYLCIDPVMLIDDLKQLQHNLHQYQRKSHSHLPPFQGGIAGYLSYDLGRKLEILPSIAEDDQNIPDMILGLFDLVIAFDHKVKKAWAISNGLPETDELAVRKRAKQRLIQCLDWVDKPQIETTSWQPLPDKQELSSNFSAVEYRDAVQKAIDYIKAGDIFEVNLSQRFFIECDRSIDSTSLYFYLREKNPAPFAAYVGLSSGLEILSSSPERFLQVHNGIVEARPIKGTIKRSSNKAEDLRLAEELQASDKDRAENIMIVDLMRNDLSRVCKPHSVKVPQLCGLESYSSVHHLVSVVIGELKPEYDLVDLLKATFPGGSITGAPKIRAMEIIDELEPTRRGVYCGSVVCLGLDGFMDSSILIRTIVLKENKITFQGGGAIVLDSDPELEYQETLLKVKRLKQILFRDFA